MEATDLGGEVLIRDQPTMYGAIGKREPMQKYFCPFLNTNLQTIPLENVAKIIKIRTICLVSEHITLGSKKNNRPSGTKMLMQDN